MCQKAADITSEGAENQRVRQELKTRRSLLVPRDAPRPSASVGALDAEPASCFLGLFQLGLQQQLVRSLGDFVEASKPKTFCLLPPAGSPTDRLAEENTGFRDQGPQTQC